MSEWLFDLGNTRLKCAPLQGDGSVGTVVALAHGAPDFLQALDQALPARATSASLASVASPALTLAVVEALTTRFQRISLARSVSRLAGVGIAYAEPARLGVDRFLALLAAHARGPRAWLVVGVGTALTLDLLAADGHHHGGRIAPSPALMRGALHAAAAQLPEHDGNYREFATDTTDALASGCEGAALGLIERSLREGADLLAQPPGLLLHGGGAAALHWYFPDAVEAPALVLEGLGLWSRAGIAPAP
ncbi:type III pantothenate kinase [Pseudoxanthomonas gei]|uniref:Type III pantothenate kinase n=1 Tax=Pseudoxanthomonas gei TaxID=1383030 RepID=A0ABX0AD32_9GAMM|nr:type III pantothenate kinase [Pseudoxanthomonas gei]NDK38425.1 type III pantothenate kinase [Pseudoxanthomonas gei]